MVWIIRFFYYPDCLKQPFALHSVDMVRRLKDRDFITKKGIGVKFPFSQL